MIPTPHLPHQSEADGRTHRDPDNAGLPCRCDGGVISQMSQNLIISTLPRSIPNADQNSGIDPNIDGSELIGIDRQ